MNHTNSNKKIKVLFTIGNLSVGGAEKLILNQIKNIDRNKFTPYLCTLFTSDANNYSEMLKDSRDVLYTHFYFKGPWDLVSWVRVFNFLRTENFDIFCCHLFESNFIIRILNLFFCQKPVFIFEHNIYWQKEWWKILADRILARSTSRIFVDSNAILDFTSNQEKVDKSKFAILPYPIELTDKIKHGREKIKGEFGLPQDSFVIGAVARFVEQKGISYLIKAAEKVLRGSGSSNMYFLIVGYGKLEFDHRKMVEDMGLSDRILIKPAKNIKEVLPALDIFVISSLWEGQPIAMLEAMAAGCPVVATKVGGIPEIIVDGKNGLLAEPKDSDSLATRILELARGLNLRNNIAKEALLTVTDYGLPVYIKKLEKYFVEVYQERK
ncbi:MAG: glycosyltransferase [Candidatus Vogelbacteria bacterium]|nr:glycosyltransferase [Candidatus Vogelbacteria bacterium]